jgi:hypothetical protein
MRLEIRMERFHVQTSKFQEIIDGPILKMACMLQPELNNRVQNKNSTDFNE